MRTSVILTASAFLVGFNISQALPVKFGEGGVRRVESEFAVLTEKRELDEVLTRVRLKGDPYVVRSMESSIFLLVIPYTLSKF